MARATTFGSSRPSVVPGTAEISDGVARHNLGRGVCSGEHDQEREEG